MESIVANGYSLGDDDKKIPLLSSKRQQGRNSSVRFSKDSIGTGKTEKESNETYEFLFKAKQVIQISIVKEINYTIQNRSWQTDMRKSDRIDPKIKYE